MTNRGAHTLMCTLGSGSDRSRPLPPPTRTREVGPTPTTWSDPLHRVKRLHPDHQIWNRGHSFVASRGGEIWITQNWDHPKNHVFVVFEPVILGKLMLLKCPSFLDKMDPTMSHYTNFGLKPKFPLRISLRCIFQNKYAICLRARVRAQSARTRGQIVYLFWF